jgi:hypothetical protein
MSTAPAPIAPAASTESMTGTAALRVQASVERYVYFNTGGGGFTKA